MLKNINFKKVIIFFITLFIFLFIYLIKVYITYDPQKLVEEVNYSKVVLDRKGEILSIFLNSEEEFHIKYDGEVPEILKIAVINYEDKKFYSHSGVDYPRILNLKRKEKWNKKIIYPSLTYSPLLIVTDKNSYRSEICIFTNFKV